MGQNLTFGAWEGKTDRKLDLGDCVILQDEKLQNGLSCFLTDCFGNLERKREKKDKFTLAYLLRECLE